MRELKDRLRVLDAAQAPDLWADARQRTPRGLLGSQPNHRRTSSRIGAAVVAIAASVPATAFLWQAFRTDPIGMLERSAGYINPSAGWSVSAPPSLSLHSFGTANPMERGDLSGVSVANFPTDAVPSGNGMEPLRHFPPTGVCLCCGKTHPVL
jgi:hypothetical protein